MEATAEEEAAVADVAEEEEVATAVVPAVEEDPGGDCLRLTAWGRPPLLLALFFLCSLSPFRFVIPARA